MAAYRVAEGTQVHVNGVTYVGGDKLPADADPSIVAAWAARGWVTEVTPTTSRKAPRTTKRPVT